MLKFSADFVYNVHKEYAKILIKIAFTLIPLH
jgi:hypothetical protein